VLKLRGSDFEMQCNPENGLSAEPSKMGAHAEAEVKGR
jgi:hypothetical protein